MAITTLNLLFCILEPAGDIYYIEPAGRALGPGAAAAQGARARGASETPVPRLKSDVRLPAELEPRHTSITKRRKGN